MQLVKPVTHLMRLVHQVQGSTSVWLRLLKLLVTLQGSTFQLVLMRLADLILGNLRTTLIQGQGCLVVRPIRCLLEAYSDKHRLRKNLHLVYLTLLSLHLLLLTPHLNQTQEGLTSLLNRPITHSISPLDPLVLSGVRLACLERPRQLAGLSSPLGLRKLVSRPRDLWPQLEDGTIEEKSKQLVCVT